MKNQSATLILVLLLSVTTTFAQSDIFSAARRGDVKAAQALIRIDPDTINAINDQGYSPLILAAYYGRTDFIELLINNNVRIEDIAGNSTALQACCYKGYTDATSMLLKYGADPNICDANGTSPLIYATQAGHVEIVRLLLKYQANREYRDKQGFTAMDYAEKLQHDQILAMLK